ANPDRLADVIQPDVARPQLDHLVRDPELSGQTPGVAEVRAPRRADGQRHAIGMHLPPVQQGERAVEAAGEDDADRQIGIHPDPDAVLQRGTHELGGPGGIFDRGLVLAQPQQVDIGAQLDAAVRPGPAMVAGRYLRDRGTDPGQGLDLGRDVQAAAGPGDVQRFYPERVPGQIGAPASAIDDGEGELAAETPHRLGVAVAAQLPAERAKFRPQLAVVEDLAVVAEQPAAIRRVPRLDRALPVYDRKPLRAGQQAIAREGFGKLAARSQRLNHCLEDRPGGPGAENEGDAAHRQPPSSASKARRSSGTAAGLMQTCHAWPSSITLTSPAACRSRSRERSTRSASYRRYQRISMSVA